MEHSVTRPTTLPPLGWLISFTPLIALLLLWLVAPEFDRELRSNPPHFWIIGIGGALALGSGLLLSEAARRRADARVFLVSMTFLSSAGFVLLHALSTPNVLLAGRNVGFILAAPIGMVLGAVFAVLSANQFDPQQAKQIMQRAPGIRWGLVAGIALFSVLSLLQLPPFAFIPDAEQLDTPPMFCLVGQAPLPAVQLTLTGGLLLGTGLYAVATARYLRLYQRRPSTVLAALVVAFALLALTTLNLGLGRTWRMTWWQWHVLLFLAFGLMLWSAYRQYVREGSASPAFDSLYLDETVRQIRQEYRAALDALVAGIEHRAGRAADTPLATAVAGRFDLSDGQLRVLEQAAEALANERDQITRLGALVAVGQETRVILDETTLLRRALAIASDAFVGDRLRVGIISAGRLHFDDDELLPGADRLYTRVIESGKPLLGANHLVLPLHVKGHGAGLLEAVRLRGSFAERDHYLLLSLASQLSTALENTRLYRQLDGLFRQYMPASVATALLADPSQAALGGAVQEITVLFADLRGFTTLAERMSPPELVALLNRYFGAATTVVLEQGGTIDKFMGDAMMALFNTPTRQPDHALRACRAALAMQQAIAPIAATAADLPRFGIGIASGRALVGNIGSEAVRNFTAIGDTVNLAARLQTRAAQGQVLLSGPLYAQVQAQAIVQPLGQLQLKGKAELVDTYALLGLRDE